MTEISGWTAPGFKRVRDAFAANFDKGLEVGAAFAAYHRGEKVADLWGGLADPATGRPWDERTLVLVFSTTKGVTAVCANKLASEGALDVDAPVAKYWPEFAAAGKAEITVASVLSHQAGLAWIDGEMSLDDALAWDPVVDALARQAPHWKPGARHGYHGTTYGWLVGELVRLVSGKSVGSYFRSEIAEPLGLDFWIGLPAQEESRVAALLGGLTDPAVAEDPQVRELMAQFMGPETTLGRALFAPDGALAGPYVWSSRALHAAEVPAVNGIGDARSLARMYAACIGTVDGVRLLSEAQMARAATRLTTGPDTVLMDMDQQFGLGFTVPSELMPVPAGSFGHFGAGGSCGWADPSAGLAFGYVMNRMEMNITGDRRSFELTDACYAAVR
jgi:CubicO group peptidase (beta-lactamase class C family)